MVGYFLLKVWHASIRDFYCVSIYHFSQWVVGWKTLVNKSYKFLTNICLNIFGEWGVEPSYFSLSVIFLIFIYVRGLKSEVEIVSTFVEGILVWRSYSIKFLLIARD